jgi:hypothetical protein
VTHEHVYGPQAACPGCIEAAKQKADLPAYIVQWLRSRNGGELQHAFADMRVCDYELLLDELKLILAYGGHPPNWVK